MTKNVLISMYPYNIREINKGENPLVLKTSKPKVEKGDRLWLYAPDNYSTVAFTAKVADIISLPPKRMWETHKDNISMDEKEYNSLFRHKVSAYAIVLKYIEPLIPPVKLSQLQELDETIKITANSEKILTEDDPILELFQQYHFDADLYTRPGLPINFNKPTMKCSRGLNNVRVGDGVRAVSSRDWGTNGISSDSHQSLVIVGIKGAIFKVAKKFEGDRIKGTPFEINIYDSRYTLIMDDTYVFTHDAEVDGYSKEVKRLSDEQREVSEKLDNMTRNPYDYSEQEWDDTLAEYKALAFEYGDNRNNITKYFETCNPDYNRPRDYYD